MSVDHKIAQGTIYPDMKLDQVFDAEIEDEHDKLAFDLPMVMVSDHLPNHSFSFSEIEPDQTMSHMVGVAFPGRNQMYNNLYLDNVKKNFIRNGASDPESLAITLDTQAYLYTAQAAYREELYFEHPTTYMIDNEGNLMWNVGNEGPESIALVLVRANGDIERLGEGDSATSSGVVDDLVADDELYMMSNKIFASMRDTDTLNRPMLNAFMDDEHFPVDIVRVAFNEAVITETDEPAGVSEPELVHTNDSEQPDATTRTVTGRQKRAAQLRESLGLPSDATPEEVKHAKWLQRNSARNRAAADTTDTSFTANTPPVTDPASAAATHPKYTVSVPPMPDYAPTNHLQYTPVVEQQPTAERFSWKEKMRHPLAYLASQMGAYHAIHQNKLEQKYSEKELTERNEDQEKALKVIFGATATALVFITAWKLGQDMDSVRNIGLADGEWVTGSPKTPAPETPPVPAPKFEFSTEASTVTSGEGWYQTIQETTGVTDPARQAAILQKIGPALQEKGWAYPMSDGTWGISRPGALPRDVLELIKNSR